MKPIPEQITVNDPRAGLAFAKTRPRAILFALMQSDRSSQELQTSLCLSLSLLSYHLTRLQELGLVRVVRRVPRAGRPITIYGAAARSFLVTRGWTDTSAGAKLRVELDAALERSQIATGATLYCLDEKGAPRLVRRPAEGPAATGGAWWFRLSLSQADADALTREIRDLIARYRDSPHGSNKFLYHFALAKT